MPKTLYSIAYIVIGKLNLFTINLSTMSLIYQKMMRLTAIAIGTLFVGVYSLPLNAQSTVSQNSSALENIETEENKKWGFTSEDESISVQDDLKELRTYSISDDEDLDVYLEEEDRRWGNRGDVEDYTFEVEVYDY